MPPVFSIFKSCRYYNCPQGGETLDFVHWLLNHFTYPEWPVLTILAVVGLAGILFGLTADPLTAIAGLCSWLAIMYHLYQRE